MRVADHDAAHLCLLGHLLVEEEFFVELLARAETCVGDLYIDVRRVAGETDQGPGHIVDPDRFAHVEDKDLALMGKVAGLEDEARRLGDSHEEAGDVLVRNGYGTALLDLFAEERYDGSVRAEDVAEPDRDELCFREGVHILDHMLGHALRSAHDARGMDGLIGRYQDKPFDAMTIGCTGGIQGPEYIVLDGLRRAVLHKRDMLVRRRVEYDVGLIAGEDLLQALLIPDGSDLDMDLKKGISLLELKLQFVSRILIDVEDDKSPRPEDRDLTAEFGTDGSASAGHEDGPARDVVADGGIVGGDLGSCKEIGHLDFAERYHLPRRENLVESRYGLDLAARFRADIQDVFPVLRRRGGDAEDDDINLAFGYQPGYVVAVACDLNAADIRVPLVLIVVDDDGGADSRIPVLLQLAEHGVGHIAGADDHGLLHLGRTHPVLEAPYDAVGQTGIAGQHHGDTEARKMNRYRVILADKDH